MIIEGNLARQVADRIYNVFNYSTRKLSQQVIENMHNQIYDDIDESKILISVLNIQMSDSQKKYAVKCLSFLKSKIDDYISVDWSERDKVANYTIEIQANTLIIRFPFNGIEIDDDKVEEILSEMAEIENQKYDITDRLFDYDFIDDATEYSVQYIDKGLNNAQYSIYDLACYLQESDYCNENKLVDDLKPLATELNEIWEQLTCVYDKILSVYKNKGLVNDRGEESFDDL